MNQDIRLGVIGTNFVSDWLCETVCRTEGICLSAVYSRTAEKGGEFAAKHGIPAVYTDMETFLSSPIDAVYIASPNFLHFPQAMAAIGHGKHVLVEKPACLDAGQWKALTKEALVRGLTVLEAMRPGHDPAVETARDAMKQIGRIRRAVFDFCQYSSRYDRFRAGEVLNAFDPSLGNAALMDIGCYALHVCVMLFGEPREVYARSVILENGMEGMGTAFLTYPGMQAEVVYSKITESANPSAVTGEDGTVLLGKLSTMERVSLRPRDGAETVLYEARPEENNMIHEVRDFVRCVRREEDPAVFRKNTAVTLAVMDEIRRQNGIVFPVRES